MRLRNWSSGAEGLRGRVSDQRLPDPKTSQLKTTRVRFQVSACWASSCGLAGSSASGSLTSRRQQGSGHLEDPLPGSLGGVDRIWLLVGPWTEGLSPSLAVGWRPRFLAMWLTPVWQPEQANKMCAWRELSHCLLKPDLGDDILSLLPYSVP